MSVVEPGRLLHGRYRLVAPIARGGMSEVWEGVDDVLTRPIAVKVLHPHLAADEGFQERFRREAIAAARLAHRNVVATFDTGEDDGIAFIVMELIRGRTLRALLEEQGALPAALVRDIGLQVAEALQHAHQAGLVHRDVKPANVLVCDGERDSPVQVKVADFGIARAAAHDGADLTQPGALLGTAKYLSPEQVQGGEPGPRSDVYALGVVLYELVTGRPPFAAATEMATAMAHVHTEPLTPRQLRAGIPRSLEAVVCRAMAKDPDARYATAGELAGALRSLDLGDDAVPSVVRDPTPPSGVAPTFRQTERSWLVPAAVIVAVAVALILVGIVLSQSAVGPKLLGGGGKERAADAEPAPIALAAARSFDPQGKPPVENEEAIASVWDGDPATSWRTDRYNTREFGGLKDGVGIVVELPDDTNVRRVRVSSPTSGWSGQVYVADAAGAALADWGGAAADESDVEGTVTFDLGGGRRGRAVLVWFTRLGADERVTVDEITVEG